MSDNRRPDPTNVPRTRPSAVRLLSTVALVGLAIGFAFWRVKSIPTPYRETSPMPKSAPAAGPAGQVAAANPAEDDDEPFAFGSPRLSSSGRHFYFKIDPKTPVKDLLPQPPKARGDGRPVTGDDLARVPEVSFQEPIRNEHPKPDAEELLPNDEESDRQEIAIAYQMARINHLNVGKADSFLAELRAARPDLAGLPFAAADACYSDGERNKRFVKELARLRAAHRSAILHNDANEFILDPGRFWARYRTKKLPEGSEAPARVAAMMQVLTVEPSDLRPGLVNLLADVDDVASTQALARLAVFSSADAVRHAALGALSDRRRADYTDVLLQALRYPWPAVARRAAEVIARLDRRDLLPQLVDALDEPDPRAPVTGEANGKSVAVVRELVRVNHHRNCLLCHPPGNVDADQVSVTAPVPLPCQPLPSSLGDYGEAKAELLVRFDVTYLRQDFSVMQPVADAAPWPEMQRFDFLVRTRELTDAEATAFREAFATPNPKNPSPYRQAALAALREMTRKDAAPTAAAWRRLLELPQRQ
jgi:hypothetical protein